MKHHLHLRVLTTAGVLTVLKEVEANPYGILLGWIMAAIYMGGRLPQIYLNVCTLTCRV